MKALIRIISSTLSIFIYIACANAYEVIPTMVSLDEVGRGSAGVFRLNNNNPNPLTVEVSVFKRTLADDGTFNETPAEDDFIVMPPQAYVEPGEFQIFRVRYLGTDPIAKSESYRLLFRQLPIDLAPLEGSGVRFLMNVGTLMFVSPPGVTSMTSARLSFRDLYDEMSFETTGLDLDNPDGVIVLSNQGDAFEDLSNLVLELKTADGSTETLTWEDFSQGVSVRFILPGGESRIPIEHLRNKVEGRITEVNVRRVS